MPPLRIVFPLTMFMILTSGASGQEVDEASFSNLAKQCQMRASVAASSRAIKIKDEAIAQHQAFNGSRVDRTGRIVFFGHAEAESDQEMTATFLRSRSHGVRFWHIGKNSMTGK